ncbi:histidine kinase [Marinilabiliaceae bacterium JC017]|nr:histidine kinase [Marinilabiliaceae bacterium JC017]
MEITFLPTNDIGELERCLESIEQDSKIKGLLLIVGENNQFSPQELGAVIRKIDIPLFGGIFPGIIYENRRSDKGIIVIELDEVPELMVVENVSETSTDFENAFLPFLEKTDELSTFFVFIDGFASRINDFVESLFVVFGLDYKYVGGGAGSLSMKQTPCIITNKGVLKDAAVIAGCRMNCGVGVKHGWETLSGPFKVTNADGNRVITIDHKPAFITYQEVIKEHSGAIITQHNFLKHAKAYPLGISKIGAEKIVRDPFRVADDNSIVCVGEIKQDEFVYILVGDHSTLLKSAKQAKEMAIEEAEGQKAMCQFSFFIDCISRALFLGDDFQKEIDAVYNGNRVFAGALTIGEIANNGKAYLEFYNKTAVVACF